MPNRAPTPPSPATPRHALRGLVCLVLLGWLAKPASARIRSHPRSAPDDSSAPYLRVVGSLPLRIQPAPVTPTPAARTAASGPPFPVAPAVTAPAAETPATPPSTATLPPADITPAPATATPPPAEPAPIIPDETRPRVQPEDFLPYFQFPGSPGTPRDVSVAAPLNLAPNPPHHGTPSTATYRQQ